jgi:hypothetical protein
MASNSKNVERSLEDFSRRLDKIEAKIGLVDDSTAGGTTGEGQRFCCLPEVPRRTFGPEVSDSRARLILLLDKKWVNGTKLRYYFFEDGPYSAGNDQMDLVRQGFEAWEDVGIGISFEEVSEISEAEIRIGFLRGDGAWSYVGRDVIDVPGQWERTMNFGWDLTRDPRGVDTPVHEIGHTLGFPHEHQNPIAGIVWDEEAVYDYFGGPPNRWPRSTTYHNVLRKLPLNSVAGSDWDPNSIMHYSFPPGLILRPENYRREGIRPELGLSESDIEQVRKFYPPFSDKHHRRLEPFQPQTLDLQPGEQANFTIEAESTAEFTLQTFGRSDVVMVLFEEVDGELRYVDGDDDSGFGTNARIVARLRQGRRYVLRIRMYLNYASGKTVVMLW